MKSNYKRLGDYIKEVNSRNVGLKATSLLGVNIDKYFMPSVANVIGTDLTTYKIVKKDQFACNLMHVGRDYRLPVALSKSETEFIVSPAYDVFEVKDSDTLLPEYLMMWFSRKEFDRNAWFFTDADVRGGLHWKAFCDMKLPVPAPDKQKEIIKEYNVLVNRVSLNDQFIQKLEETAQAIYKQWFVEYEFPDSNGNPYKSSGGKMVFNEELGKEIPKKWINGKLGDIIELFDSKRVPLSDYDRRNMKKTYPYYGAASLMDFVDDYIFDGTYILLGEDGSVMKENGYPILQYVWGKFWVNNHAHIIQGKNGFDVNSLYMLLANTNVSEIITGGVQAKISQINLRSLDVLIPDDNALIKFNQLLLPIFESKKYFFEMDKVVNTLKDVLLAKLTVIDN